MEDSEVSEGSKDSIGADHLTFWLKNKVCFFFWSGKAEEGQEETNTTNV